MSDLSTTDPQDDVATEAVDPTQNLLNDGTVDGTAIEESSSGGKYY